MKRATDSKTAAERWALPAKQARSQATRERILRAAERCFAEAGYDGAHISAIARKAGCSVGAVYFRFKDKDALFFAIAESFAAEIRASLPDMLAAGRSGRADAIIGLVNSEGAAASILAGKEPSVLLFADFGANALAHGIVVHRDTVAQQPDLIRRFMAATVKSWQYAIANRKEAVDALMKRYPDAKSDVIARQLERTIPLLHAGNSNQPIGFVNDADAKATLDLLEKFGGLKSRPALQSVFTNAFLPTHQK